MSCQWKDLGVGAGLGGDSKGRARVRAPKKKKGNTEKVFPVCLCPLQDSNLRNRLRRPVLYPLS